MSNKYLEKIAEKHEYTDKQHAKRHMFGAYGLLSKKMRDHETVGGYLRTQGRGALEAAGGAVAGTVAGGAAGHALGRLAGKGAAGSLIGGVAGYTAGALGGGYHGALASIRNRIHEGKLHGVKDTSKK